MITVEDIMKSMERLAPTHFAESWDNVGLMMGSKKNGVSKIITTLDVTPAVVDFAIREQAHMIVSHHPFIFKGLTSIDLDSVQGQMIERIIKHDIAVYSAHTNLDIAEGGLNDMLAEQLGLADITGFVPVGSDAIYKVTTFVPEQAADAVRQAMAEAGAGRIGNYEACSFSSLGEGRFKGNDEANPVIGESGTLTVTPEVAVQIIVDKAQLAAVITAMKGTHPYEEVAYEVIELVEPSRNRTLGRRGILPVTMSFEEFKAHLEQVLPHSHLRFGGVKKDAIRTVALCSGAGASFIKAAKGADVYITGDVKYHDAQLAKELGLLLVDAGHFGTEEIVTSGLAEYLKRTAKDNDWDLDIVPFLDQEDFFFYE
ncbi:Nif3-like dinuclear metal center hexameric protein [Veillonella agrestimuris]|uniref:Nif3-like dinuclear metal center hexameric protein n=1 Tax=Veillonella agrestimuris TaxID=2941340 RepID=UPI0020425794|nr:Nif3-like dinuclear metal center hexameric protein [Veillonella agrestimuris]